MDTTKTGHGQNPTFGPQVANPWIICGVTPELSPSDQMHNGKTVDCPPFPIGPMYSLQFPDCSWLGLGRVGECSGHRWNLSVGPSGSLLEANQLPSPTIPLAELGLPCAHSLREGRAINSGPSRLVAKKGGYLLQTQLGGVGQRGSSKYQSRQRGGEA